MSVDEDLVDYVDEVEVDEDDEQNLVVHLAVEEDEQATSGECKEKKEKKLIINQLNRKCLKYEKKIYYF